jgi:hypothetical protein
MSNDNGRRVGSQAVGIGCGSLIVIALLIWFLAGGPTNKLAERAERIEQRLERIEQKLDQALGTQPRGEVK